ncbi:D-alanyl-alanine synthetase A [Streptomyces sp. S4.7]|uniref:ATP-grasp domain-containing protein n=1 Tax=Streptomyces sp. S4.7 TaxID=2705439 RepID=UPI001397B551|nr:hypothetical protein [Streptomyces sp. S4.7]QHY99217.1 D-alanyl-alanine synthetase A [Streptomyces sp. S4.7]
MRENDNGSGSSLTRIAWIYPERRIPEQRDFEENAVWRPYQKKAAELGLELTVNKPEELAVDITSRAVPRVFLKGEQVTPEDTLFVTSLYSLPHQLPDVPAQLHSFTLLEHLGFYLPVPPALSYIGADKGATAIRLKDCPVPVLPTARFTSGREAMSGHYDQTLADLDYPLIVKPATWGMGLGVSVVHNIFDLRGVIGLAGGSDTPLVVQPYFPGIREYRIFTIEGKPHTTLTGIKDGYCLVAMKSSGGSLERGYVELPEQLADAVRYVYERVPAPYLCVDFLQDGERFWLSEIELDGAVRFTGDSGQDVVAESVVEARFRAYMRGHAEFTAQSAVEEMAGGR